ncbi:hypothetical protein ACIRF8_02760 [Streptomyces sp. NPDC102406]|uniref:hypothetical protein n=1 Tax=Streptomyces sp. NPDC102406 TaxID=3366171 RepID=UPI00382F3218
MADDKGGGSGSLGGWAFNVVEAAKGAAADIVTELESFTKFQQRVDQLIKDLKGSPAGPKKVSEGQLTRQKFGGGDKGWYEADDLYGEYSTVIRELENLSEILSGSIESMGFAVLASHKGFENIDSDIRDRMAAINAETRQHYGGDYVPPSPAVEGEKSTAGSRPGDSGGPDAKPDSGTKEASF